MTPTSAAGNRALRAGQRAPRVPLRGVFTTIAAVGLCCLIVGFPWIERGHGGDRANTVAGWAEIERLKQALGLYKLENGTYPETLDALWKKPAGVASWQGPYVEKEIRLDPWGRPFLYKYPGDHGEAPDVKSLGPYGQESEDDVVSWPKTPQ